MKQIAKIALTIVILLVAGIAWAQESQTQSKPDQLVDFYNQRLDLKIDLAKKEASWRPAGSSYPGCMTDVARTKADFYEKNRDQLVQEMLSRGDIGMKPYKVDYFLITTFNDANSRLVVGCRLQREGQVG